MSKDRTTPTVSHTPRGVKRKQDQHSHSEDDAVESDDRERQRRPDWADPVLPLGDDGREALNAELKRRGHGGRAQIAAEVSQRSGTETSASLIGKLASGDVQASGATKTLRELLRLPPLSEIGMASPRAWALVQKMLRLEREAPKAFDKVDRNVDQVLGALDTVRRLSEDDE
jgi:hypothetical protein